jgi:asparagine synthase (glutamine-hydrolysing)
VEEEYFSLLDDSVRLRFRSDVPVGICLSGGVDSSTLLGLVQRCQGPDSSVEAFTYVTGDSRYDELAWVDRMLAETRHPSVVCALHPAEVPALAESLQEHEDEPFGGLPTLAYSRVFERARSRGVTVLLDGQGLDEQWAGYDYYETAGRRGDPAPVVQGTSDAALRPECLVPAFGALAEAPARAAAFPDPLRQMQYRDIRDTKLPRALRFNDRASMRSSIELREPFLDHRLFELALRQPADRKIRDGVHKWLLRRMAARLLPSGVVEAPKRPLQTPQREWLRGPLRPWADACIEDGLAWRGGEWLDRGAVRRAWGRFADGEGDNSYFVWQWMSLGLLARLSATRRSNASARLGGARAPARPEPFVESGRP